VSSMKFLPRVLALFLSSRRRTRAAGAWPTV